MAGVQKKVGRSFLVSLIILMILSATDYAGADVEAQKPNYSIGDYWKYSVTYFEPNLNGTTTKKIVGESNITVDSRMYNCFEIETSHIMEGWAFEFDIYIEKHNFTIVKEDYQVSLNGEIIQVINTTYTPPFNELDFPITIEKNWTAEGIRNVTTTIPPFPPQTKLLPFSQNFSVVGIYEVNVPAGEFEAFAIEYLYLDGTYEEYYSSRVSGNVRESYYDREGGEIMRMELLESNYVTHGGLEWWIWLAIAIVVIIAATYVWRTRIVPSRKRSSEEYPPS